ncbi:hypothetical protein SAMN02983003_1017 [Devosia enhydra]|uniref:THAP4-like heme-binding beta-barrel domain-containing protein n=1 Tax=Devosia enhydra TaxID=665118 RepID=A0A1K2HUW4_9HYPH|nr:hypothetical protein [Devosia enhydra]SFZ82333.1 hypothetical protein SAMN02983003_1017 [Devosia enhydra]
MSMFRPLLRNVALVGLVLSSALVAAPTQAARAEIEFLSGYLGEWRGRGTLTGASSETVVCRLTLSPGNSDKINYNGRCTMAGNNLAIQGTLAYVDSSRRYEAVMSTNATFQGVAVGQRRGNGVVFNLQERNRADGQDMSITAAIALQNGKIDVNFKVTDAKSGGTMQASVPFSK